MEKDLDNYLPNYKRTKKEEKKKKKDNKAKRAAKKAAKKRRQEEAKKKREEEKKNCKEHVEREFNNNDEYINEKLFKKGFNTICNFHNKFGKRRKNLFIQTNSDNNMKFNNLNNKKFKKYLDFNKTYSGINNHKTQFKFTEPKVNNDHKMKIAFNFK